MFSHNLLRNFVFKKIFIEQNKISPLKVIFAKLEFAYGNPFAYESLIMYYKIRKYFDLFEFNDRFNYEHFSFVASTIQ